MRNEGDAGSGDPAYRKAGWIEALAGGGGAAAGAAALPRHRRATRPTAASVEATAKIRVVCWRHFTRSAG